MPSPLICGSFQNQEDEDFEFLGSFTSPRSRKPAKWHSFGGSKGNKNPYADRGLDKFSALVAELDSRRKKIYTQKGSEDISLIGFVYSNSDDYKPIVVKLKNKKQQSMITEKDKLKPDHNVSPPTSSEIEPAKPDQAKVLSRIGSYIKTTPKKVRFEVVKNINTDNLRRPWYYFSLITIFILVSITVFGRSFAVLCTTLGWYLVPTIQNLDVKKKPAVKKKNYAKALSYNDKLITSRDNEMVDSKKTKTMKKAMSYSYNKNVKISSSTFDHGIASPSSVLSGYKSPPQPASPPPDRRLSFPTQGN
ncbi:hypothetical protein ACET3Z_016738 [Daucus carota]